MSDPRIDDQSHFFCETSEFSPQEISAANGRVSRWSVDAIRFRLKTHEKMLIITALGFCEYSY